MATLEFFGNMDAIDRGYFWLSTRARLAPYDLFYIKGRVDRELDT